jgi:LacI family transcriptional regulator
VIRAKTPTKATMKEVAEAAGVSVATVSRVLNGTGFVSPELTARVQAATEHLHYQPSALARGLRVQATQTVGILIPQLHHPFFSTLTFALEKTLFTRQYRCFVCSAEEDAHKEDAYIEMLLRQRVDGVILVPTGHSARSVERLLTRAVPVVLLDRDLAALEVSRVLSDNYGGALALTRYLLGLGHRRVGVISSPPYSEAMALRRRGVADAFAEAGLPPPTVLEGGGEQFGFGYEAAQTLLQRTPRPSALVALTDVLAVGALHAAAELGLRVPEALSVTGFDDIPLARHVLPALTTVAQPLFKMGEAAAQMLLRRIAAPTTPPERVVLPTALVRRRSAAPPAEVT